MRRKVAAEYITSVTGCVVPHTCDGAFRVALQDGVQLCHALNSTFPGAVPKVG
jgi:hypothetical protein